MRKKTIEKIASKIVVAESLSSLTQYDGIDISNKIWIVEDGAVDGPIRMMIKKLTDDEFEVICFKKSFYSKKPGSLKRDMFRNIVEHAFSDFNTNEEIEKKLGNLKVSDLIKWRKKMDTVELVKEMLNNYEMTFQDIEKGRIKIGI